jgi:hypothetical protein
MKGIIDPAAYEAWYHTPRGGWIGDREFALLQNMLRPEAGASLLDAGCGTCPWRIPISRGNWGLKKSVAV